MQKHIYYEKRPNKSSFVSLLYFFLDNLNKSSHYLKVLFLTEEFYLFSIAKTYLHYLYMNFQAILLCRAKKNTQNNYTPGIVSAYYSINKS